MLLIILKFSIIFVHFLQICIISLAKEGLLLVPGLGRSDRTLTVAHNVKMLESFLLGDNSKWDCLVYIYASPYDNEFWSMHQELDYISSICSIVENPGKRVTENLYMAQPALFREKYTFIFTLLDDCKLLSDDGKFPLDRLINIMVLNSLTVASPLVQGANIGGGQKFRNIMQTEAVVGTVGYVSTFVEIFAWITTIPAYQALWELLYPSVNPYGWGYDFWYDNYARRRVPNHKMGIISTIKVFHDQDLSISVRTDNTKPDDKWRAVMEQEKVYYNHFGVPLRNYRRNLNIRNTSWNGAVIGYLYDNKAAVMNSPVVANIQNNVNQVVNTMKDMMGFESLKKSGKNKRKKYPTSMKSWI